MSYRISTAGMHYAAITQMLAQQAKLAQTQSQISSGKRVQNPADDPVAATQIMGMEQTRAQLAQFTKNTEAVTNRLNVGEQALADASNLLQRVRDLTVQANSAALGQTERASIATELKSRVQELQDLANRRDANGEYLFAGMSSQTKPFSRGAGGVSYAGDQGVRAIQVSADQRVTDGFSGQQVFMDIPQGNGTFSVTQGMHTGTGSIDPGVVANAGAWVPGTYTLQFTSASNWQVVDASSAVVASGAYTSGGAIAFNGAQLTVTGAPATGDTYTIAPASKQDVFTTLDQLVSQLTTTVNDPVGRATLNTQLNGSLNQIDQSLNHLIDLRAELGSRLSTVDSATTSRQQLDDTLAGSVGKLQDLDYATAVSSMNQQLLGLQAAQQAYTRIAQLSLFSHL